MAGRERGQAPGHLEQRAHLAAIHTSGVMTETHCQSKKESWDNPPHHHHRRPPSVPGDSDLPSRSYAQHPCPQSRPTPTPTPDAWAQLAVQGKVAAPWGLSLAGLL